MLNFIFNLLKPKSNNSDMVRYIRTEFANDTKHLRDEDVILFYNHFLKTQGVRTKCHLA